MCGKRSKVRALLFALIGIRIYEKGNIELRYEIKSQIYVAKREKRDII